MPTGRKHVVYTSQDEDSEVESDCRCTIGEDHDVDGYAMGVGLSASEAEDIWRSSGMDEDYDFR